MPWEPNPNSKEDWQCEEYIDANGNHIARIEYFWYGCYPSALNPKTGEWERGGNYKLVHVAAAKGWAEHMAGLAN